MPSTGLRSGCIGRQLEDNRIAKLLEPFRGQGSWPVLPPNLAPTLYRPDADPQIVSDDCVLVPLPEPLGRLQPQLLADSKPFVGRLAPLRVPHPVGTPHGSRDASPYETTLCRSVGHVTLELELDNKQTPGH